MAGDSPDAGCHIFRNSNGGFAMSEVTSKTEAERLLEWLKETIALLEQPPPPASRDLAGRIAGRVAQLCELCESWLREND